MSNALPKLRTEPMDDPSLSQRIAAQPDASVWVAASAGTGKTKVLTDRVLRLLLPREDGAKGAEPHRILCLTYTKAAANEMALRINKVLSGWATKDNAELDKNLYDLLGRPAKLHESEAARRLFARVVDAPGGLKIMTIHSFCQSVLGRFPLEAGLPPHFKTMEEDEAARLLTRARDAVLARAQMRPDTPEGKALVQLAAEQNEDQFSSLLRALTGERHQLQNLLGKLETAEGFYETVCRTLGVHIDDTPQSIALDFCRDGFPGMDLLWQACAHLAGGSKTDRERGLSVQMWLERDDNGRITAFKSWVPLFLTKEGEKRKSLMTTALRNAAPDLDHALHVEADRIIAANERLNACRSALLTRDLVILGQAIGREYQGLKDKNAALDFDDLIHKTLHLLQQSDMAGWVLYKLDGGLDHILIDEAQDTNPEQWDIAKALTDEFFSGKGARDLIRTLFVVGDVKQSIYSFQRAAPEKFMAMQAYFKAQVQTVEQAWHDVPLHISFRSSPSVLDFVDAVFADEASRKGLGDAAIKHESFKQQAGRVEIWPLFKVAAPDKGDPWEPALEVRSSRQAQAILADHIAGTIKGWMVEEMMLPSRGRAIQPGDILVLVRRRSAFVGHLIRALKKYGVPVSGIDRMVLNDQLAVQDLLAVAQAALLPEDDLTLATVLKSPFIGWSDAQLEDLAMGREKGETLWDALRSCDDQATLDWLKQQIRQAGADHPYEFFSRLLQSPCPADPISGLHAVSARLGDEALDPLTEFLNQALAFEAREIAALQLFLLEQAQGSRTIKREQEEAGGRVRIMTVHASKGLQAPIVFLPDTVVTGRSGANRSDSRLLWPDKTGLPVPLWSPRKAHESAAYLTAAARVQELEDEEYRRLLYVAMTRAEDRLYVCGWTGRAQPWPESWYNLMLQAFDRLEHEASDFEGPEGLEWESMPQLLHLENVQALKSTQPPLSSQHHLLSSSGLTGGPIPCCDRGMGPPVKPEDDNVVKGNGDGVVPAWVYARPKEEPHPPRPLMPSRPTAQEPAAQSPLAGDDGHRFRRGTLTHLLLQTLPDLPESAREQAALRFAAQLVHGLPENIQHDIVRETLLILNDPAFAPLFGPGSQAEVPVTGLVHGRLVSGQIDRLLVTNESIWIVDYKTNRPPPARAEDVPEIYRQQLRAYAGTLAAIWPGRPIRTFLLWTDGAKLMEIRV